MSLRDLVRWTRADREQVERVKGRLDAVLGPAEIRGLLKRLPAPDEGSARRVKQRLARVQRADPGGGRVRVLALAGGLAVGIGAFATTLMDERLDLGVNGTEQLRRDGFALAASGRGEVAGTVDAPVVLWHEGQLELEVEGELALDTREAAVRGSGAAVGVHRDGTGTRVAVHVGEARVRCLAESRWHVLVDGLDVLCPPVSADGMLNRARQLQREGASPEALLEAVDGGLSRAEGSDAARAELAVLRAQVLADGGRGAEALAQARSYLSSGEALRHEQVQGLAAALALQLEGCDGALQHLEALAATRLDAALRLATCVPTRARAVLEAAEPLARTENERAALEQTRNQLIRETP